MRPASRVYRWLLRVAPARLRERHGDEMEELFLHALEEARQRDVSAVIVVWMQAVRDLVAARVRSLLRRERVRIPVADSRRTPMLGSDIRYALRSLARQKASALLVIGMLAIGIAANVAVFSFVNGLFLRPFPFPEPDRLVYINEKAPQWNLEKTGIRYFDFWHWHEDARVFDSIAVYAQESFNASGDARPERIQGARVTRDFARVLGIVPVLGRVFTPEEDKPNGPRVVMIGQRLWRERFGGDAGVIGQTLRLDGEARTIVGVLPAEADFPGDVDLWLPLAADPLQRNAYRYSGIGRLKAGVTAAAAEGDLLRAQESVWQADDSRAVSPFVRSLHQQFVRDFNTLAATLFAGVALLLIVACANVASVMLARTLARRPEIATRLALGATRARLVRQLFVENLVLAAIGGVMGLVLGQWAVRLIVATLPDQLPRWATYQADARLLVFAVAAVVGTVILFGWAPALHAMHGDLRSAVQASTKGTTSSPTGRRTLWCLVAGEFALVAVLLMCGGLLLRAFDRVRHVDPGFRTDHVLTFRLALPESGQPEEAKWLAFWERLTERLRVLPGVRGVGLVNCGPMLDCHEGWFFSAEGQVRAPGDMNPVVLFRKVNASYFEAMGIRLRSGRFLEDHDGRVGQPRVFVVNETFARMFWPPGTNPVGRHIRPDDRGPWATVVGVVGDIKHYGLERPVRPGLYEPLPAPGVRSSFTVVLRTAGEPTSMVASARDAIREIDPELPMFQVKTMEEALQDSMRVRATYSWVLAAFAGLAFVLALGGAYGVASYLVSQRTREIGIRVALGARMSDITRTVVGHGLAVVAAGVAVGIAASFAAARVMSTLLFETSPRDLTLLTIVTLALLATALLAQLLPARRAARTDPMRCLRTD